MRKHLKVALTSGATWLVIGCGQGVVSSSDDSISTGESTQGSTNSVAHTSATSTVTPTNSSLVSSTSPTATEDESDGLTDQPETDEAVAEESDEEDQSADDETSEQSEADAGDVDGTNEPTTDNAGVDNTSMTETSTVAGDPTSESVGPDPLNAAAICTSNEFWTRGEGTTMRPGEACVACHTAEREGPRYAIAGTLYPTGHEPSDCNGSATSDAKIVVIDANGQEHELTPNQVGNFYYSGSIATPYTAKVVTTSGEREMFSPQTNGDCNSCHTATGINGAPGRIVPPF